MIRIRRSKGLSERWLSILAWGIALVIMSGSIAFGMWMDHRCETNGGHPMVAGRLIVCVR